MTRKIVGTTTPVHADLLPARLELVVEENGQFWVPQEGEALVPFPAFLREVEEGECQRFEREIAYIPDYCLLAMREGHLEYIAEETLPHRLEDFFKGAEARAEEALKRRDLAQVLHLVKQCRRAVPGHAGMLWVMVGMLEKPDLCWQHIKQLSKISQVVQKYDMDRLPSGLRSIAHNACTRYRQGSRLPERNFRLASSWSSPGMQVAA